MTPKSPWTYQWEMFDTLDRTRFWDWVHPLTLEDFRGKTVLDAGCGSGAHLRLLAPVVKRGVGVDLHAAAIARERLADLRNVAVIEGDVAGLNRPEKFDIVYSVGVVHHTEDPDGTVANLARLVKPGGVLAVWVYGWEGNWLNRVLLEWAKDRVFHRLPRPALRALAWGVTAALYPLVQTIYRLPIAGLPYHDYFRLFRELSFYRNWINVFDKMNAPRTHFIPRAQVEGWFPPARFTDVHISPFAGVSWRGSGRVRAS